MSHLLSILALAVLLFGWVLFQQWLRRNDPEQFYRPGCGACGSGSGSCSSSSQAVVVDRWGNKRKRSRAAESAAPIQPVSSKGQQIVTVQLTSE